MKLHLNGDTQQNALSFAAFLRKNKIPPKLHVTNVVGDGDAFPHIRPWVIFLNSCDFIYDEMPDNDLMEAAWKHAHVCDHFITNGMRCGCGKQPGSTKTIFGKKLENICHCPLQFINPDAKTLESIKNLLLLQTERRCSS